MGASLGLIGSSSTGIQSRSYFPTETVLHLRIIFISADLQTFDDYVRIYLSHLTWQFVPGHLEEMLSEDFWVIP